MRPMEPTQENQFTPGSPSFLCLKCRESGHILGNCPYTGWLYEFGWFFSEPRRQLSFGSSTASDKLCQRCQDVDILKILHEDIP